jgi:hypothetical protein
MSTITFTVQGQKEVTITHEDAVKYVIDFLRYPRKHSYGDYGYDLYLNTLLIFDCKEILRFDPFVNGEMYDNFRNGVSPFFMDACWELCRRGILPDMPHTPVDFHEYLTPYSCLYGLPRSCSSLRCSSVRFNTSGHCPETLSRCIPTK